LVRVEEQAYDGRRILLYVLFVLTLLAGVFAADVMIRTTTVITAAGDALPAITAEDDDEEEFEEETASRSMIG
jgi:hypothetical protein